MTPKPAVSTRKGLVSPCCDARMHQAPSLRSFTDDFYACSVCAREFSAEELLEVLVRPMPRKSKQQILGFAVSVNEENWAGFRPVPGHTWPVKDDLKAMGGRWNQTARTWMVPEGQYREALEMVRIGIPGAVVQAKERTCWECGKVFPRSKAGSVWDESWCGCAD